MTVKEYISTLNDDLIVESLICQAELDDEFGVKHDEELAKALVGLYPIVKEEFKYRITRQVNVQQED